MTAAVDAVRVRGWERRLAWSRLPSAGEVTAILRRNGQPGLLAYAVAQRDGHYGARSFVPVDRARIVEALTGRFAAAGKEAMDTAERALAGELSVLGSGPVDVRRGTQGAGHCVDWQLDPISGGRYPRIFSHRRWDAAAMGPEGADVKGPWELTRAQHLTSVGQAYWLTGDTRYAEYYAGWIDDFLRHNPRGVGVHWACTMDVALRVVGWLTALPFFQGAPSLTASWWRRFCRGLVAHGRFIVDNLEFGTLDGRIVTSNHYLANLLGLHWLALNFPGLDAGAVWRGLAERGLEHEVRYQLLDDGGDFESSVPYHRLVVEMLLSAWALSQHHRMPLSDGYRERLVAALAFVRVLRQANGRMPQVGDADDGRAHILSGYGSWWRESMDHLLIAGAHVLGCPELAQGVPDPAAVEALFWGDPGPGCVLPEVTDPCVLPDSGLAVLRRGPTYALITNGPVGTDGFGNHKHNDQLAIEWVVHTQPLVVDGGSYTYTQDPSARNHFRSTATHNTVMVGGQEQHTFDPRWLFRMFAEGESQLGNVRAGPRGVGVLGSHTAYKRLGVGHTRRVLLLADGAIVVDDFFECRDDHELRWHFLVHPDVSVIPEATLVRLEGPGGSGTLESDHLTFSVVDGWYSPRYGVRRPTSALICTRSDAPDRVTIVACPEGAGPWPPAEAARVADEMWSSEWPP